MQRCWEVIPDARPDFELLLCAVDYMINQVQLIPVAASSATALPSTSTVEPGYANRTITVDMTGHPDGDNDDDDVEDEDSLPDLSTIDAGYFTPLDSDDADTETGELDQQKVSRSGSAEDVESEVIDMEQEDRVCRQLHRGQFDQEDFDQINPEVQEAKLRTKVQVKPAHHSPMPGSPSSDHKHGSRPRTYRPQEPLPGCQDAPTSGKKAERAIKLTARQLKPNIDRIPVLPVRPKSFHVKKKDSHKGRMPLKDKKDAIKKRSAQPLKTTALFEFLGTDPSEKSYGEEMEMESRDGNKIQRASAPAVEKKPEHQEPHSNIQPFAESDKGNSGYIPHEAVLGLSQAHKQVPRKPRAFKREADSSTSVDDAEGNL